MNFEYHSLLWIKQSQNIAPNYAPNHINTYIKHTHAIRDTSSSNAFYTSLRERRINYWQVHEIQDTCQNLIYLLCNGSKIRPQTCSILKEVNADHHLASRYVALFFCGVEHIQQTIGIQPRGCQLSLAVQSSWTTITSSQFTSLPFPSFPKTGKIEKFQNNLDLDLGQQKGAQNKIS